MKKVEDWSAKAEERLRGRLEQHVQVGLLLRRCGRGRCGKRLVRRGMAQFA